MAVWRSRAALGLLLVPTVLGVGCSQGSGSYAHTEPPSYVEVMGAQETRVVGAVAVPDDDAALAVMATPAMHDTATDDAVTDEAATDEPAAGAPATDDATADQRDIATATLAEIHYPWRDRLVGWQMVFLAGRPGIRGLTIPVEKRIEIYVRADDTPDTLARVVAHELGHAADVSLNDAGDRERWRAARGAAVDVPWWPHDSVTDFATMAGDFAEAFAAWQTGVPSRSTVAGPPTRAQLDLLATLVS
jgi:hypothetical protein